MEKLRASINGLEAQRSVLGDAIVNPALAALRKQLAALEEQAAVQLAPTEERRMVTILFFDIVGSTSIAEKVDPEEWRQVVAKIHTTLGKAITTYHGIVAQYLGDGLLAFFGAKEASEHEAENAIRAALDGLAAVTNLPFDNPIQLRTGIHSGLVVVGDLGEAGHKEFTASGDAMNLAARLQAAAPPGGILISSDTYRYVRGVFDVTPRPPLSVKGKSEPIQTYLVRRAKPRPFRSVARGVAGIETRTIGRDAEIETLQAAYLRAFEQHGMVWAQLISDPGVGKSRLVEDMSEWLELRDETTRLLRARAFPDDINQPFSLVRRMWFDRFQIAEDAPLKQAEKKWVEHYLEFCGQAGCEEAAHALGLLVGLPFQDSPYIGAMRNDPAQVKGRALVVSRELIEAVRQQNPVVVLLEDLHWADAASWDYLMEVFLRDAAGNQPNGLFILGAARPEWRPPEKLVELLKSSSPVKTADMWGVQISLALLPDRATRELAEELLQRTADVPENLLDLIIQRSEGIPYFAEEIVNWMIDHGILDTRGEEWLYLPDKLKEQPLPATLQHLLLTRLSHLSQVERAALQRGAIFGRRFWTGGVEALGVTGGEEMLGHLQPRGFVEAQPESAFQGDTEWSFHHNLLQEVTYESVLKRERASLHKVAADWLERQASQAGRLDEFAGLLGEHYERAEELSTAVDWYLRAGQRAMGQGAPREARDFFTRALDLLPPVDRERRWQALLGRQETLAVLSEAELEKADLISLLDLARSFGDDNYLAEAYLRQAVFGNRKADRTISKTASLEALAAAQRCRNEAIEAKALALIAVGNVSNADQSTAIQNIEEALRRARQLEDRSVLAYVLFRAAFCYSLLADTARAYTLQLEQIELEHRLGNRHMEAMGLGNLGSTYVSMGQYKQARSVIEQAQTINEGLGSHRLLAYNLGNLAEICLETGDLRMARQIIEQSSKEISPSQDVRGKVIGIDILGRILIRMGDAPGAYRRFSEAYEIASSQDLIPLAYEAKAGLVASAAMEGRLDEARQINLEVWNYLKDNGWVGMENPGGVARTCAEIFDALGDIENARAVIETSYQVVMEIADKINVPEWRRSFLENVPDNRTIIEMWERIKQ